MSTLAKYWKIVLALILAVIALLVVLLVYLPGRAEYEMQKLTLDGNISVLQASLTEALKYPADLEEDIQTATQEIEDSRLELYQHFPSQMKEEDQLIYLLGLEDAFGTDDSGELGYSQDLHQIFLDKFGVDITYSFGTDTPLLTLSDGAILSGQTITVYFSGPYDRVKEMIRYLGTEEVPLTSIQYASLYWSDDAVTGTFTLLNYLLDSDLLEYHIPVVDMPDTGKSNIFD
ncbi:hypothetical protein [Intestinimonas massiliensis (ex Afouda et al. 2020)]|uniref:hypothetical protein n=1 Tax=Intestinimonas massiliensis (ex Afouda et al. 2020) TaxID=1673721 RepID=UPI00102FCA53|nr:hypothetical protein [Intestinimonas massiliensis (ex Afouda et al. 2020)]